MIVNLIASEPVRAGDELVLAEDGTVRKADRYIWYATSDSDPYGDKFMVSAYPRLGTIDTVENEWVNEILKEYLSASEKFGNFNSAHEGYAVIKEELDELWDLIKMKGTDEISLAPEAIQIGAMALKFLVCCCRLPNEV